LLLSTAVAFSLLTAVFWPLERMWSARPGQPWVRAAYFTDVLFFLGQYLLWGACALFVLEHVHPWCLALTPGWLQERFGALPFWAQALAVVALGDVSVYWFHRASHAWPLLWRFHAVHHTSQTLDWVAAHREHPVDGLLTQLAINLPAMVLGFPLAGIAWFIALRGMWAIFIHSNVRLPLGPLRKLLGAPELHHWHHLKSVEAHNFANLAPWTDLLFGTYFCPEGPEDWPLGVVGPAPTGYLALLVWPFLPQRVEEPQKRSTS
jgi:sterol desaturase/sphingolipid hydroxylase (fatty acid hydroxylase superfamily)